jgi:hypothetical protein
MPAWFPAKILTFKRASCGINYLVYGTFYLFAKGGQSLNHRKNYTAPKVFYFTRNKGGLAAYKVSATVNRITTPVIKSNTAKGYGNC